MFTDVFFFFVFIKNRLAMIAKKLMLFMIKHQTMPNFAITTPAIAGPITLATLKLIEFSATTLGMYLSSSTK